MLLHVRRKKNYIYFKKKSIFQGLPGKKRSGNLKTMEKVKNMEYMSKYASSIPQNQPRCSINGYKPFVFVTKIPNCH